MQVVNVTLLGIFSVFIASIATAQPNTDLNDYFEKVFVNLNTIPLVSYKVNITTLEASNVTSTYVAEVFESNSKNTNLSLYKFSNAQLFVTYSDSAGVERFWLGKEHDLPEVRAKDLDNKLLQTAIAYTSLLINPLWLSLPVSAKQDQGFLVIQAYNKNRYSNNSKIEYYLNKDNIPVRILYYNSISNFPTVEILINNYKKSPHGFFIYQIEYRDNARKKTTVITKTDVNFNPEAPRWLDSAKQMVKNNIKDFQDSFMAGVNTEKDINESLFSRSSSLNENRGLPSQKTENKSVDTESQGVGRSTSQNSSDGDTLPDSQTTAIIPVLPDIKSKENAVPGLKDLLQEKDTIPQQPKAKTPQRKSSTAQTNNGTNKAMPPRQTKSPQSIPSPINNKGGMHHPNDSAVRGKPIENNDQSSTYKNIDRPAIDDQPTSNKSDIVVKSPDRLSKPLLKDERSKPDDVLSPSERSPQEEAYPTAPLPPKITTNKKTPQKSTSNKNRLDNLF